MWLELHPAILREIQCHPWLPVQREKVPESCLLPELQGIFTPFQLVATEMPSGTVHRILVGHRQLSCFLSLYGMWATGLGLELLNSGYSSQCCSWPSLLRVCHLPTTLPKIRNEPHSRKTKSRPFPTSAKGINSLNSLHWKTIPSLTLWGTK